MSSASACAAPVGRHRPCSSRRRPLQRRQRRPRRVALAAGLGQGARRAACRIPGAARRFEPWGEPGGVPIVHDHAFDHPTELRVTLETARRAFPGRELHVLFQPHQASRTALQSDGFVEALRGMRPRRGRGRLRRARHRPDGRRRARRRRWRASRLRGRRRRRRRPLPGRPPWCRWVDREVGRIRRSARGDIDQVADPPMQWPCASPKDADLGACTALARGVVEWLLGFEPRTARARRSCARRTRGSRRGPGRRGEPHHRRSRPGGHRHRPDELRLPPDGAEPPGADESAGLFDEVVLSARMAPPDPAEDPRLAVWAERPLPALPLRDPGHWAREDGRSPWSGRRRDRR